MFCWEGFQGTGADGSPFLAPAEIEVWLGLSKVSTRAFVQYFLILYATLHAGVYNSLPRELQTGEYGLL